MSPKRDRRSDGPEPNRHFVYDSRGNTTESRAISKTAGTPADIVVTASYPVSCTNPKTCNQPTNSTDPRGNVTDYTYDTTHGGVLTVTQPAPTVGAVRPQVRYSYSTKQAYYKNSGGSIVASGQNTYLLSTVSACQTLSSCAGAADEVKATVDYGPQTAGTPNNLLPISVSKGSGNGTLTATVMNTYDTVGNLTFVDGPLSGTADTTRTLYDADREVVGQIGPDPDGGGALVNRAVRLTYNADGQVTKSELGTTSGQSDSAWSAFAPAEFVDTAYDTSGRKTTDTLKQSTTAYALTQYSYDSVGRLECVATRMNTAVYGSLPTSACTLGTAGSFGQDRISKRVYDVAGETIQSQVAVGTTDAATEATLTYSNNGKLATLKDAENNLTTYEYDGFDRLSKTRMPDTTKGSGTSSTTDYEQLAYDAASNVTNRRLRDAQNITFTFDNLNRPTLKNLPGTEPDVTYAYDNLGRLTSAAQTGNSLSFSYDALSRNLTQVGPQGTVTSEWDLAGRRTKLTYPGSGLYLDYDYLVTGEMTKIRENGASSGVGVLATYGYDNFGRQTSLTFGNGASQAFGYDAVSRLSSLTNDLTGTSNDLSATFGYSPASQVASTVRTGDAYAWTGHFNTNVNGTANGLNQLTSVGPKGLTHDARGNVTAFGTKSFTYSSENLLLTGPGSTTLSYDPGMRLQQIASSGTTTKLAYDRLDRIAEYDGSNSLLRRYVHGPGEDEPLVWYEGTGTSNRTFMSADDLGSIISLTDSSGAVLNLNKYDEFGNPQSTNTGAFGYTGQTWLSSIGLWHYKARVYDPELSRFLQTDPINVAGGINLYAYVGNDPINATDPLGLEDVTVKGLGWCASHPGSCSWGSLDQDSRLTIFPGQDRLPSLASLRNEIVVRARQRIRRLLLGAVARAIQVKINMGKTAFCAAGSYSTGGDIELYIGGGVKLGAALVFDTATGDVYASISFGAGIGIGGSVSGGLRASSDRASGGRAATLDSRLTLGTRNLGIEGRYNIQTIANGKRVGSQGLGGTGAVGYGLGTPVTFVPLDATGNALQKIGSIDTPCD